MPLSLPTDLNYITQTPSGTLDNTALTLIQVLILRRGLAVIYLDYRLLSISCSSKLKTTAKILGSCFSRPQTFVLSCLMALLLLSYPQTSNFCCSVSSNLFLSSGLPSLCLHVVLSDLDLVPWILVLSFDATVWCWVTVRHQHDDFHQTNLFYNTLKQVHKTVAGLLNSVHKPCKGERCCSGIWRILAIAWSGFLSILSRVIHNRGMWLICLQWFLHFREIYVSLSNHKWNQENPSTQPGSVLLKLENFRAV